MVHFCFSKKFSWFGSGYKYQLAFCKMWFQSPFIFWILIVHMPVSIQSGKVIVLRPFGMLLQSSPCMSSSCMSLGAHIQLDTLFTNLSFCSLPNSFWRLGEPTFLIVWLKSWGFTFHDYVSLWPSSKKTEDQRNRDSPLSTGTTVSL